MKRTILISLLCLELAISLVFLGGSIVFVSQVPKKFPISDLTMTANLLRQYADAVEAQRDNIDRFGSRNMPAYAVNLRELSYLTNDLQPLAEFIRQVAGLTSGEFLGIKIHPMKDLEVAAGDLEALMPRLSKTLGQTSTIFRDYTKEDHEKLIKALDSTILQLRNVAGTIELRAQELPGQIRMAGMALVLLSCVMLLFVATQLMLLPPAQQPSK